MIKTIFILVGGRGTRLGDLTKKTPKPLLKFNKKVFLDYILSNLISIKPKKIYLLCGYKSELFFKKYHNKKIENTKIYCIKEKKLLGTGGSIFNSRNLITDYTLICNGDTYFEYNFKFLNKIKLNKKKLFLICINNKNYKSNKKLANLSIKKTIVNFNKKSNLMNAGIYVINRNFKKYLNKNIFSIENDVIENLILSNKVIGKKINCFNLDVGTKKNYYKFQKISKNINLLI